MANDAVGHDWLAYDMDIFAAIDATSRDAGGNGDDAMDWHGLASANALSDAPGVTAEARDVVAMLNALNDVPLLTPADNARFLQQPYEEREAPGKVKRPRKTVTSANVPFVDSFAPPSPDRTSDAPTSGHAAGVSAEDALRETQRQLDASIKRNGMLQRQISKTLEIVRAVTAERDMYKHMLAKAKADATTSTPNVQPMDTRESSTASTGSGDKHSPSPPAVPATKAENIVPSRSGSHESSPEVNQRSSIKEETASPATTTATTVCHPSPPLKMVGGLKIAAGTCEKVHRAYDRITEVCARSDATDQEYIEAIKGYCVASLHQNFIMKDEIDAVCSPQFMMRNFFINNNGAQWAEPHGARMEKNLDKWAAVMKGCDATPEQSARFAEFSTKIRNDIRLIMEERHAIMTELMEFFAGKVAYFQRMFLGEEDADSRTVMKASTLLSRLRANLLHYCDAWIKFLYVDLLKIFSPRQMAQIYMLARRTVTLTSDALEAVNQLALTTDGTMPLGGSRCINPVQAYSL